MSELDLLDDDSEMDTEAPTPQTPPEKAPKAKGKKAPKVSLTPEQMEARIAELEEQNLKLAKRAAEAPMELPEDPDAKVTVVIPLTTTGFPITINGKQYKGKMEVTRRVLDQVLSMLGAHAQIQAELTQPRGTEVAMGRLMETDAVSRIKMRHKGQRAVA